MLVGLSSKIRLYVLYHQLAYYCGALDWCHVAYFQLGEVAIGEQLFIVSHQRTEAGVKVRRDGQNRRSVKTFGTRDCNLG